MIYRWHTNQERIPGIVNLRVGKVGLIRYPAKAVPEFCGGNQPLFEIIKKRIMVGMRKKLFRIGNSKFGKCMLSAFKINQKNNVSVIKDDVLDIVHELIYLSQYRKIISLACKG